MSTESLCMSTAPSHVFYFKTELDNKPAVRVIGQPHHRLIRDRAAGQALRVPCEGREAGILAQVC
jgi:hypothetical protein